jgi:hypothetical protein
MYQGEAPVSQPMPWLDKLYKLDEQGREAGEKQPLEAQPAKQRKTQTHIRAFALLL